MSTTALPAANTHCALLVGDALLSNDALHSALAGNGFHVERTESADTALALAPTVDLIVFDLGLSELDPFELCRRLRSTTDAYIVAVGRREAELELVLSLSVGADDFVPKPVQIAELLPASGRCCAGRGAWPDSVDAPCVRPRARRRRARVRIAGEPVGLSSIEFDLLTALAANPSLTLSREQLLRRVWGPNWFGDDHVIDVHISNLRRKLRDNAQTPKYIRTVRGFGFRLQQPPQRGQEAA